MAGTSFYTAVSGCGYGFFLAAEARRSSALTHSGLKSDPVSSIRTPRAPSERPSISASSSTARSTYEGSDFRSHR